jgi:hypothetical protein
VISLDSKIYISYAKFEGWGVSKTENHKRPWYRLDNAATLYPSIESLTRSGVFRLAITLTETIEPRILEQALARVLNRFPAFRVRLRKGVFWHYFEHNDLLPPVTPDVKNPCMKIEHRKNNYFLFRVRYHNRQISTEFFHALTDGTGGMMFLKSLAAEYLRLKGISIPFGHGVEDPQAPQDPEEAEDAYKRYFRKGAKRGGKDPDAFHPHGTKVKPGIYHITSANMSLTKVLKRAKELKVSLTEYFTAIYLFTLYKIQERELGEGNGRPVRVSVPVNLRSFFPSKTLRNFASYVKVSVNPSAGTYSFEEVLKRVHYGMRLQLTEQDMIMNFSPNVSIEQVPFIRLFPLPIKNFAISFVFNTTAENLFSGAISNIGRLELPEEMYPYVERFDFNLGPGSINNLNCGILSYQDQLFVSFGSTLEEATIEREFCRFLIEEGFHVEVRSNRS